MWYADRLTEYPLPWRYEDKKDDSGANEVHTVTIKDAKGACVVFSLGNSSLVRAIWDWYEALPEEVHESFRAGTTPSVVTDEKPQ